jgi:hypothetical protein
MRRRDILSIGLALLLGGGVLYGLLLWAGLDTGTAQQVSSAAFMLGCLGWTVSYLRRVLSGEMTLRPSGPVSKGSKLKRNSALSRWRSGRPCRPNWNPKPKGKLAGLGRTGARAAFAR